MSTFNGDGGQEMEQPLLELTTSRLTVVLDEAILA